MMPKNVLCKDDLDKMPGCQCGCNDPEVYLHASCHVGGPFCFSFTPQAPLLGIKCGICQTPVVLIALAAPAGSWDARMCHPEGIEVKYVRGSGLLDVQCRGCKAVLRRFKVGERGMVGATN